MFSVPKCLTSGIISQVFPLHEPAALERLQNTWVRDFCARQPLGIFSFYKGRQPVFQIILILTSIIPQNYSVFKRISNFIHVFFR